MHRYLFLNTNWTFFLQRQNAYRRVSALHSQGKQHIGIPFLQELHVRLGMQSSWLCQTHTTVSSSERLAPIQALCTGNRMAVTLFMWLQDNVFWVYVFTLEIHKMVPTQEMAWKRLQNPLVPERWLKSGARTNLEGRPQCQVPDENKINLHGASEAVEEWLWLPNPETLCQERTAHVRGCKMFFPTTKQEEVRSAEVWPWSNEQAPTSVTLGLRPKDTPNPR